MFQRLSLNFCSPALLLGIPRIEKISCSEEARIVLVAGFLSQPSLNHPFRNNRLI